MRYCGCLQLKCDEVFLGPPRLYVLRVRGLHLTLSLLPELIGTDLWRRYSSALQTDGHGHNLSEKSDQSGGVQHIVGISKLVNTITKFSPFESFAFVWAVPITAR